LDHRSEQTLGNRKYNSTERINLMFMMLRSLRAPLTFSLAAISLAAAAAAQDAKPPALVSLITVEPVRTLLGELTRENQTHIEVVDLKTGELQTFAKADLKTIRRNIER